MSVLAEVYASAPAGSLIIPSLEIRLPGTVYAPVRICSGFEDQMLGVDGAFQLFEAGSMSVSLPSKVATGVQTLNFGVAGVNPTVRRYFKIAQESGQEVLVIYREYLESDKLNPARKPYEMQLLGGTLENDTAQLSSGFFDLLNRRFSRDAYTTANAPGIRYL